MRYIEKGPIIDSSLSTGTTNAFEIAMTLIQERGLFGGAITGAVPESWLDGSTIREVPDHQELFLSPTTLSNVIVEINEYVPKQNLSEGIGGLGSGTSNINADSDDVAAAMYHILDVCDDDDTMDLIQEPRRIQLKKFPSEVSASASASTSESPSSVRSETKVSAYAGFVRFTSPRKRQRNNAHSEQQRMQQINAIEDENAASGSTLSSNDPDKSTISCYFVLVRLPAQETDLLVFVNVPHDEFISQNNATGLAREEDLAKQTIDRFAEVFDVKDWGLFGSN